ncbi:putative anti-sigma-M factor YhdL [Paenibacillus lautus]|uniref:anti sigma factor C-terminal domain-containing protein n=1 Tax=Paenibacillus lautus TaxID=1401 RepID=UPI001B1B99B2|nr:anti sigma factor C-terminal domain-containing protein [Paenibacillus lautus]GIP01224.1 putative anti-sigma-M factor YhdL [Paenibacillus lautus]
MNALSATLMVFLIYGMYYSVVYIYHEQSGLNDKFSRSVMTTAELHESGLMVDKRGLSSVEVTPFLTQKKTLNVYKDVGEWQVIVGELHAKKRLGGELTYSIEERGPYLNGDERNPFYLQSALMEGRKFTDSSHPNGAMNQLEKLEDGNVAVLFFSLRTLRSPEEVLELLSDYDVKATSMAVFAGELKDFKLGTYSSSGADYMIPHLTLRPKVQFGDNHSLSLWHTFFSMDDGITDHVKQLIADVEWMTDNIKYNGVDEDTKRLAYLRKNGVQVYGATVTGPVRELEKLKEEQEFWEFRLGRIEVWNWS